MARKRQDGTRGKGIRAQHGKLYIIKSQVVNEDGRKKYKKKWIPTGLPDKPEYYKVAAEMRKDIIENQNAALINKDISISEFTDLYLKEVQRTIANTTYSTYLYRAKRIKDHLGAMRIRDLDKASVEEFLDVLFTQSHLIPQSVKDTRAFLSRIMAKAIEMNIISKNPVSEATLSSALSDENDHSNDDDNDFLTVEDAQLFLSLVEDHRLYELFYFTLFFGLRREEVLGLKWSCIDFKAKSLRIKHTVTKGTKVNRRNKTKTEESGRKYPLTDEQIDMLHKLKKRENKERSNYGNCYANNDYIFKRENGVPYYPDHPTKVLKDIVMKHPELPQGLTFRGLRASCVSILVHEGRDVKSIQKWVGHSNINTTLQYYTKARDQIVKQDVSENMSGILRPKEYKDET